jgi:hypothetical protein
MPPKGDKNPDKASQAEGDDLSTITKLFEDLKNTVMKSLHEQSTKIDNLTTELTGTVSSVVNSLREEQNGALSEQLSQVYEKIESDKLCHDADIGNLNSKVSEIEVKIDSLDKQITDQIAEVKQLITSSSSSIPSSETNDTNHTNANNYFPLAANSVIHKTTSKFDGREKYHVVDFTTDLDNYLAMIKAPEDMKLPIAIGFLEGSARDWGKAFTNSKHTYDEFKTAITEEYWGEDKQREFEDILHSSSFEWSPQCSMKEHFIKHLNLARRLTFNPKSDRDIISAVIGHYPKMEEYTLRAANLCDVEQTKKLLGQLDRMAASQAAKTKRADVRGGDSGPVNREKGKTPVKRIASVNVLQEVVTPTAETDTPPSTSSTVSKPAKAQNPAGNEQPTGQSSRGFKRGRGNYRGRGRGNNQGYMPQQPVPFYPNNFYNYPQFTYPPYGNYPPQGYLPPGGAYNQYPGGGGMQQPPVPNALYRGNAPANVAGVNAPQNSGAPAVENQEN